MPRANEIKKVWYWTTTANCWLWKISTFSRLPPGAATLYKMLFLMSRTGLKVEERFQRDDIVDTVTLSRRGVDFSASMATNMCSWIKKLIRRIPSPKIDWRRVAAYAWRRNAGYAGSGPTANCWREPRPWILEIVETAPVLKERPPAHVKCKPATLSTGLVIQVPEYLSAGEKIRIHIEEAPLYGARGLLLIIGQPPWRSLPLLFIDRLHCVQEKR